MGLLLTALAFWAAASLGLAAVWVAVAYGTPRILRPTGCPPVFVPQPRAEWVDETDLVASPTAAAAHAPAEAIRGK